MAGYMSTPSKTIKSWKKHCQRVIKRHRKETCSASDGTKKRNTSFKKINSDAGARVSDYAVSEFVHVDFENGATTTHRRSKQAIQFGISQVAKYFNTKDLLALLIMGSYVLSCLGKADEGCSKRKNILDHSYGSFKGLIEDERDSIEKIQDNALKFGLSRLVPSVSFNDKILSARSLVPQSQRKPSAVFKLSFKRRSCDAEETIEQCQYRPRPGYIIPCCRVEKPTSGSWSEIPPSTFKFRGENYFKYDFGVDVFVCPKKIHHIPQHPELSKLPTYPAAMCLGDSEERG
ncbi:unnamed protein product [Prunus brigantina]